MANFVIFFVSLLEPCYHMHVMNCIIHLKGSEPNRGIPQNCDL